MMPAKIAFVDGITSITTQADYEEVRDAFIDAWNDENETCSVNITAKLEGPRSHRTHGRSNISFNGVENSQKPREKFCKLCVEKYERIIQRQGGVNAT